MHHLRLIFGFLGFWAFGVQTSHADSLSIDAGSGIAWRPDLKHYFASGRVRIVRANVTTWSDTAKAFYEGPSDEIVRIVLEGDVKISQSDMEIQGDQAELVFDGEVLTVMGSRPRLETKGVVISADRYIRYAETTAEFEAKGAVLLQQGEQKVRAETVTGYLADNKGQRKLQQAYFLGGVQADDGNSDQEQRLYIEGEQGRYQAENNWIRICGDAKVLRHHDALTSDCVHYDLNSANFQLLSGADLDSPIVADGKVAPTSSTAIKTKSNTGRSRLILNTKGD